MMRHIVARSGARPRETHLPAAQPPAEAHAWIQSAHGHQGRASRPRQPSPQRAQAAHARLRPSSDVRRYASLRGRREFALVLRRGRTASSKHLVVFALPPRRPPAPPPSRGARARAAHEESSTKVGIVITKKVGNAVERNRLRRRCKAILDRSAIADSPMWYDVQVRPAAARLSFAQLRDQLSAALAGSARAAGDAQRRRETAR